VTSPICYLLHSSFCLILCSHLLEGLVATKKLVCYPPSTLSIVLYWLPTLGGHAQANLSNSRFIIYVVVAVLMVVLLLTSPFYSVLVGNGYVLIKCYTAPYIRIHADITWIPPFACSLKSESGLISQTGLAIPLACIVSLPLAGFASSFKRLVPISRGSPLL